MSHYWYQIHHYWFLDMVAPDRAIPNLRNLKNQDRYLNFHQTESLDEKIDLE